MIMDVIIMYYYYYREYFACQMITVVADCGVKFLELCSESEKIGSA
jgi:hypothetical protein